MLSFGILAARALSKTIRSLAFIDGSPSPALAATKISRDNLLKIAPRLASASPFLFLILLHLLCPDMQNSSLFLAIISYLDIKRG